MHLFTTIDKYEVREPLEDGELLKSYKCFDRDKERFVHIDVLACPGEERRRGFLRDAHIASRLHHDNLARVLDFGVVEEEAYLVREFLSGEPLSSKLQAAGPLSPQMRLSLLRQMAEGLEYAHANGTIHQHLRPERILVQPGDRIKILGFAHPSLTTEDRQLLLEARGNVPALAYRSPEQMEGQEVDSRTDLFSFSVIAYELLTGKPPFSGKRFSKLLVEITESVPSPLHLEWKDSSPPLADLITRCLEKSARNRCPDFSPIIKELGRLVGDRESGPSAAKSSKSSGPAESRSGAFQNRVRQLLDRTGKSLRKAFSDLASLVNSLPRELLLGALGLTLITIFAGLIWWALPFGRDGSAPAEEKSPPSIVDAPSPTAPAPLPELRGELVLEGSPWGKVLRVTNTEGQAVEMPREGSTPLLLQVPPGTYRVEFTGPEGQEEAACEAAVEAGSRSHCRVEFSTMEGLEYFEEAGWWQ